MGPERAMDCRDLEARLERLLAGELPPGEHAACEAHLEGCPACRELLELAGLSDPGGAPAPAGPAPEADDLVGRVLARTSGSTCARAGALLAGRLDLPGEGAGAGGDPLERELLDLHLAACRECRRLAEVLAALREDLPALAEVRPDPAFVDDVLAGTLPPIVRWRRALRPLARRWSGRWAAWVRRPRFAWETAFVLTLVCLPVFGSPSEPLAAVPEVARAVREENPVARLWGGLERELGEAARQVGRSAVTLAVERKLGAVRATAVRLPAEARAFAGERWRTFRHRAASLLERATAGEIVPERPDPPDPTTTRADDGSMEGTP